MITAKIDVHQFYLLRLMCVRYQLLLLAGIKGQRGFQILSYITFSKLTTETLEKSVKYVQTPELRQWQVIKVDWFFLN